MPVNFEARETMLNVLYESASDVPAWTRFTRIARDLFAADQVAVIVGCDPAHPIMTCADESHLAAIEAVAQQLRTGSNDAAPTGVVNAAGRALTLSVNSGPQGSATIVIWRADTNQPFEDDASQLLQSLADPLRRSFIIYLRCVDLVRRASMNEIALETSRIGAALVGMDGTLLHVNSVAEDLLARGEGLYMSQGRLHARQPVANASLMAEIRRCALNQSAHVDPLEYAALSFERPDQALPLTVIIRPGPAFYPLPRPLQRTAILLLRDPLFQAPWPADTLARLFGLSAAEAQLASRLARGASLDEAAASLGVSRNTARTQLQAIFMRTGLNRQTELMRALFNSAATSA